MKLTLGPVVDAWPRATVAAFYREVAASPVDTVVLDAVPAWYAQRYRLRDWLATAELLAGAGKEVVLGAHLLLDWDADLGTLRRLAREGAYLVEANDMGAVQMLADHARFVAGPGLNVYHADMLAFLVASGARRWVPPRDMGWGSVQAIVAACPRPPDIEIAAWSRLPLDFPPGCRPAMRCARLAIRAARRARTEIAATHPYKLCCLVESLPALRRLHVESVRVDAQRNGMPRVVRAIRAALDGGPPREVAAGLVADPPALVCDHADEPATDDAPPSPQAIAADR